MLRHLLILCASFVLAPIVTFVWMVIRAAWRKFCRDFRTSARALVASGIMMLACRLVFRVLERDDSAECHDIIYGIHEYAQRRLRFHKALGVAIKRRA